MSWRYVAASVVGSGHLVQSLPCQDASLVYPLNEGGLLVVASDGAGSAEHSAEASKIACATLLEQVLEYESHGSDASALLSTTVDQWVGEIIGRLHVQACARDVPVRELACTLVAALVTPRASHFIQLGDGGAVVARAGAYTAATWPDNGEYANTTFFLTDDLAFEHLQVRINQPPVEEVAVFTDGLQSLVLQFADRAVYAPFFERMFRPLRAEPPGEACRLQIALDEYLGSADVCSRTDDDKSLVLATRAVI